MKKMIFVSTGRCGTLRLYEILSTYLTRDFDVVHQMQLSRVANVVGHLGLYLNFPKRIRHLMYLAATRLYDKKPFFISTDPLTAMLIPRDYIRATNVSIVHLFRDDEGFANSMFKLSRSRIKSCLAHNFIPLWQPGILPLENALSNSVHFKYMRVNRLKNNFFNHRYQLNPNYRVLSMDELFAPGQIEDLIWTFFNVHISIPLCDLRKKSNES